jgi:proton glutamate symport protein
MRNRLVKKTDMLWKVLLALGLAVGAGALAGQDAQIFGVTFYSIFDVLGSLFLNALTLLVIPLVTSSIISGLGSLGGDSSFGRLGAKTFAFYFLTMLLAAAVGVVMVNVIDPGAAFSHSAGAEALTSTQKLLQTGATTPAAQNPLVAILMKIVPNNILGAASSGNMLGVIAFSLFFGFVLAKIDHPAGRTLVEFWKGLNLVMMRMTHQVMKLMPYGVFFLVAKVIAQGGLESIASLGLFFLTVVLALIVYVFIALPIVFKARGLSPIRHFRAMGPALLTAFSTSSSAATLPITMECVEKRAGVSERICSFVVPLGTSVNMSGSALYECVAALFIAQVAGAEIGLLQQFLVVVMSLLTAMGMAGIPSASLVAIIVILNTMGLPAEGIALILPVDRILDMCRTTVNVFSDASCAVLVAQSEGEKVLQQR